MLSGIPQVAQIGPSLVAKNGTPFCLFTNVLKSAGDTFYTPDRGKKSSVFKGFTSF